MSTSENLLRSSVRQWKTTQRLLKAGPLNGSTKEKVARDAQKCRDSLEARRKATPTGHHDPQAGTVEELAQVLDEVISDASEEGQPPRMLVAE